MLTSNQKNKNLLEEFRSQKNRNTLEEYLKKQAWKEDLDGETRIYLVKDSVGRIVLFFSIKCGLLFRKNQYDKLEEYERTFVDMVVKAKEQGDQETINSYYEYGSEEFSDIDRLFKIAEKRIDSKNETKELDDGQYTLKVEECFSGIELRHFCRNEAYSCPAEFKTPVGFGIFWEVIVREILKITNRIGCKYLYLFAADKTENSDIKKLVHYYKSALKFYECEEDDIIIIKPEYDKNCYGLIQEISKLPENHEAVWQEFSDVYV